MGYLHEFIGCQTKQSLVYDLQERFRWIADVAMMEAFESGALDLPDFYFTGDDYRYRFESEAKRRFLDLLRGRFNSGVRYKGLAFKWDTVIEQKTGELGDYLVGRTCTLDFSKPFPDLYRMDDRVFGDEYSVLRSKRLEGLESERARSTIYAIMPRFVTRSGSTAR